ncbi:MAG: amino acid-binding protein [Rhodospirillales bacterium]|nr:amino acid-binding protein [Rhodospirillales bacterium]
MTTLLVSVLCPDRTGLVAAISGRLFELGANLGDTSFAVLGGGAEFTSVCELPGRAADETAEVAEALRALPELARSTVEVRPFRFDPASGSSGRVTHRIVLSGGDRPGLIARLSEVFVQFKANIVRLDAQRIPASEGGRYVTRFSVSIPERNEQSCLNTVANTAGELNLTCHWEQA